METTNSGARNLTVTTITRDHMIGLIDDRSTPAALRSTARRAIHLLGSLEGRHPTQIAQLQSCVDYINRTWAEV